MTRPFRLLVSAAVFLPTLLFGSVAASPTVPLMPLDPAHRIKFDTRKFMPVSELRPGMRGYALTVFKGTKIDRFGIEILGVVSKFNEGKDYILFRALDGPPVTRHLNIAHGMSGSPIYINGRLVGAISMGIPGTLFAKDPIALATPIEDMFDAWSPDLPSKISSIGATTDTSSQGSSLDAGVQAAGQNFQQIDLPVMASGMTMSAVSHLRSALAPYHLAVMAGGGGGGADANNPLARGANLNPGAAVGISLVQGDMDLTATGTVTYRDGNRVLLFGHPFTDFGPIDAPMTTAYVVDIFPSYEDSIKIGSPIKTVGRVSQDRPFSVGGLLGSLPRMVPIRVAVDDESIKRKKVFHMRVIDHPLLTAQLVTQLTDAAIAQVHGQPGDSVATVTMDADVEQIGHVHRTNTFYDALSIDQSAISDLDTLMRLLSSNPFYPLALKSLNMAVTIQNRHDTADVDHIFLKQDKFSAGDTVDVGVVLKPYKRDPVTHYIAVKIPNNTAPGPLSLSVKGGGSDSGGGISLGGGIILLRAPEPQAPAGNIAQLVKQFEETPRNNELVARLTLPTSAIDIDGEKFTSLPPTIAEAMQSARTSGLQTERDEVKETQPTPYIVSGSQSITIMVQKDGSGGSSTSATSPSVPSAPPLPAGSETAADNGSPGNESAAAVSTELFSIPGGSLVSVPGSSLMASTISPAPARGHSASTSAQVPPAAPTAPAPTGVKTIGRLASVWRQGTFADFSSGTPHNASVTSEGDVRLSASLSKVAETHETYLWALQPDGHGSVYAGTGDHGDVYKIDGTGKPTLWFKTGQLEVTALAQDAAGDLYAGTSPHGIVYKIGPDGKGKALFTAQEKYITALAFDDARNRLYVATGGGTGRVYAVPALGAATVAPLYTSPEAHLLSLALDKDGNVYAGSSPDGIVYKITPDGAGRVFYDLPEQSISALAVDSAGNIDAGTSPKGTIYQISADGIGKMLSDRPTVGVVGLQTDKSNDVYACAGNTVYRISPDATVQSFVADSDEQFLSLAVDGSSDRVYTGTGTVGTLYEIGAIGDVQGNYISTVHDAGLPARWGTMVYHADAPTGTSVIVKTRSGDVEHPDASWSPWAIVAPAPSGSAIQSPPARYLQYEADLAGSSADLSSGDVPRLRDVAVYYLPRNQAPTVKLLSPQESDAVAKVVDIRWTASDPDHDTLAYDVFYSSDGGKTWVPIKNTRTTQTKTSNGAAGTPGAVSDQDVDAEVQKMRASLAAHPEVPDSVRRQMLAQAPSMARQMLTLQRQQAAGGTSGPSGGTATALKQTSYRWDTTSLPDGAYQVKVVASDKPSNPVGALIATSISPTFVVANAPPVLQIGAPTIAADKTVTLHGTASTGIAVIQAVQGKVDSGDLIAAVADNGLFDSTQEGFTLSTPPLASGTHTIEVQAIDTASNITTSQIKVQVP